eukprot:4210356-Pleurochrysis_carterae.AAC.3
MLSRTRQERISARAKKARWSAAGRSRAVEWARGAPGCAACVGSQGTPARNACTFVGKRSS